MTDSLRHLIAATALALVASCQSLGHASSTSLQDEIEPATADAGPAFIDGRQGVLIQPYWLGGVPHYLIANLRPDDASVRATLPGPKPAPVGPWLVPAGRSVTVDVKALAATPDARGRLPVVSFDLADGVDLGRLHAPDESRLAPPPTSWTYETGLDAVGAGLAWAGVGAMTDGQPIAPGGRGTVHLVLARDAGDVRFGPDVPQEAPQLPRVQVVAATSSTFAVEKDGDAVTITNVAGSGRGTVDLTVAVPSDAQAPVAELVGKLVKGGTVTPITYAIPVVAPGAK